MYTSKYRPKTLDQICGQELVVEAVRAIVKKPAGAPRVYIFHGEFGTGKTSMARLLARLLNDPDGKLNDVSSGFREYDSSVAGSKDDIMVLREDLFSQAIGAEYRVVVLDEFHLASRQGQATLLKTLEDLPANIFVIFCTTRVDRILPTIRSRAVELAFQTVPVETLKYHLIKVVNSEGIEVGDDLLDYIARRSQGHVRDAVMMLDAYQALGGEDAFLNVFRDASMDFLMFLGSVSVGDDQGAEAWIGRLTGYPVTTLQADIFGVVTELLRRYTAPDLLTQEGKTSSGRGEQTQAARTGTQKGPDDPGQERSYFGLSLSGSELDQQSSRQSTLPRVQSVQQVQPASSDEHTPGEQPQGTSEQSKTRDPEPSATPSVDISEIYGALATHYGRSLLDLLAFLSTDWAVNCLADMARLRGLLWSLYARFRSRTEGTAASTYKKR